MKVIITVNKRRAAYLAKHLAHEHPMVRGKIKVRK